MQLDPADFGERNWRILKERIWNSRVIVDSSTDPQRAPRSTMATRQFGTSAEALEGLWTHIIPLHSRTEAEALSLTLLDRIKPNPDSEVTVQAQRWLEGIDLRATSRVRALEQDTVGKGLNGRILNLVGVVENVAFGLGYGQLGDGWTLDRFVQVAQLQADKIRRRVTEG